MPDDPILLLQRKLTTGDKRSWKTVLRFRLSRLATAQRMLSLAAHLDPEVVWRFAKVDGHPVTPESMEK